MRTPKLAAVISFYDEFDIVQSTIEALHGDGIDWPIVVHSYDDRHEAQTKAFIQQSAPCVYHQLENLGGKYSRWELPAQAICRNYAAAAKHLESIHQEKIDYILYFTGDTEISDTSTLKKMLMDIPDKALYCSRAVGQDFHAASLTEDELRQGKGGGRYQHDTLTADFMPQLFIVNYAAFNQMGFMRRVPITNRWCSEQCLGDHFKSIYPESWRQVCHRFSFVAYPQIPGVTYQAKGKTQR